MKIEDIIKTLKRSNEPYIPEVINILSKHVEKEAGFSANIFGEFDLLCPTCREVIDENDNFCRKCCQKIKKIEAKE